MNLSFLFVCALLTQLSASIAHAEENDTSSAAVTPESPAVGSLPTASAHWVFLQDSHPGTIGHIWIVDGDAQRVVGMLASGLLPTFTLGPEGATYLLGETYWSRGSRGSRSDFITYYNAHTLNAETEIPLPEGRFLVSKRYVLQLSDDERFLLSANMTPATSVTGIDVSKREKVAEVSTPGCTLVMPHPSGFSSLCANGALLTIHLAADGSLERKDRGEPIFDPDIDPVFDDWAFSRAGRRAFLLSFHGAVYPIALTADTPLLEGLRWTLTSKAEKAAGWRPGGTQPADYHMPSNRLYVLMHRGGEWTQFDPGTEVWIFDATSHRRLARCRLATPAEAIAVTRDHEPLVFTSDGQSRLSTYRPAGGCLRPVADMNELGLETSQLIVLDAASAGDRSVARSR